MSLYGKYRPKTFADVAGQNHIVETLNQALKQDKFAHAYLFAGIRGTGKTSVARLLAMSLLTKNITDPILAEHIRKAAEDGNLVDLTEIDAASNNGVDNIRDLIEKIQFTPVVAGAKVYIIDEVHMLSKGAFNALLKTLEEPPAYAYFILATTELHKIPATIQSRCQRFLFKHIHEDDVVGRLRFIADAETMSIDDAALRAIVDAVEPPYARMSLKKAQLHTFEGNVLTLKFGSSFHKDKVSSPEGSHAVEHSLTQTFHHPFRIHCVLESDLHAAPLPQEDNVNLAEAAADIF